MWAKYAPNGQKLFGRNATAQSMLMLHPAIFANRQALARRLQFLAAHVFFFTGFQALCCGLVGGGHGAVAGNVFFGFLVAMTVTRY